MNINFEIDSFIEIKNNYNSNSYNMRLNINLYSAQEKLNNTIYSYKKDNYEVL